MFVVTNSDGSPLSAWDIAVFQCAAAIVQNFPDAAQNRDMLAFHGFVIMVKYGLYDGALTYTDVETMVTKLSEAILIQSVINDPD